MLAGERECVRFGGVDLYAHQSNYQYEDISIWNGNFLRKSWEIETYVKQANSSVGTCSH